MTSAVETRQVPDNIEDERLRRLVDVIIAALHPDEIWLFGSRARDDARDDSDYDLFVVVPDDTPREKFVLTSTYKLADSAGIAADIFACWNSMFQEERRLIGTLSYTVAHEGVRVYADHRRDRRRGSASRYATGRSRLAVKDVIAQWLRRADVDITSVRALTSGPHRSAESAAYHCQQAAEKIIKAGLISAGVHPPREHELEKLVALLPAGHALIPLFRPLQPLSLYMSAFRYLQAASHPEIPVPSADELEAWLAQILGARDAVATSAA
jgi:uncharacterized protein